MRPTVVGLFTAPSAGAAMEAHEEVELIAGVGVLGDRYATKKGYWSDPRWPDQQVTLVEAETAAALGLAAGDLRRNIVTQGLRLDALLGLTFQIGGSLLLGVRRCDPCSHLDTLARAGIAHELQRRGGLRAAILTSGRIRAGDRLCLPPDSSVLPNGNAIGTFERVPYNQRGRGGA